MKLTVFAVDPHFTAIIPAEQYFYGNLSSAFASVQASISGELVEAMSLAKKCFEDSMAQGSYQEVKSYIGSCNRRTGGASAYDSMKTLYLSVAKWVASLSRIRDCSSDAKMDSQSGMLQEVGCAPSATTDFPQCSLSVTSSRTSLKA